MRRFTVALAAVIVGAAVLSAQTPRPVRELRPFVGVQVPTGAQRDLFSNGLLVGLEGAFEMRPAVHFIGTVAWAPQHTDYAVTKDNAAILTYDVGIEASLVRRYEDGWTFKPFAGIGAGARSYLFEASELNDRTCASAYGALGTEFQLAETALRLEARNNLFCYRSPVPGGKSRTRDDVGLTMGLAYHFK